MAIGSKIFARIVSHQILIISFVIILSGIKSFAQDNPDGFLSIDCGSAKQSTDPRTNLLWVEDGNYMVMGENGVVQDPPQSMLNSSTDNYEALLTFRYFPVERQRRKYCYVLPMKTNNVWILLRAMFLHGNASVLTLPIEFDVYVNGTPWINLRYTENDLLFSPTVQESIFYLAPGGTNITNVCLVPKEGAPFISSLELRRFDLEDATYNTSIAAPTNKQLYFTKSMRWNTGTTENVNVRYPDDPYDRIWTPPVTPYGAIVSSSATFTDHPLSTLELNKSDTFSTLGPEVNRVPFKVMKDAWSSDVGGLIHMELPGTEAGNSAYGIFYFALLNESTRNTPVTLNMALDETDYSLRTFNISREPSQQSFVHILDTNFSGVLIDDPFVLNAVEFYRQDTVIQPATQHYDSIVVSTIEKVLNMTGWQGDPCVPVPNDWLGCVFDLYWGSKWFVETLTLSHVQNSSRLLELYEIYSITAWENPVYLSITNSGINSTLFRSLLKNVFLTKNLLTLNMSFNEISTIPDAGWWIDVGTGYDYDYQLYALDLAHNQLSQLPRFEDIPFSSQLNMLNVSHNQITGEFPDISSFTNLSAMQELNISNNYFSGEIPSSLSIHNLPSLQILDISYNSFSGEFPSNYYLLDGDNPLQWLNADNNKLEGTLDLTVWYQKLKSFPGTSTIHSISTEEENSTTVNNLFSILNNKISDIKPRMEDFQPLIENWIYKEGFNQSGVLLGGNPFCKNAKHFTQRYLCRSSSTDVVHADVKKNNTLIILGSVLGASFLLLCFSFFLVVIWRLSRKVYVLKRVEQELANRSVQPPFYSYSDLKVATRNFHKDNHLGSGTFGAVYKGVLPNGTTIAVKRLFNAKNAKKQQVLDDFLNEVVLITGIKHTNLIQQKGCCIENEERILVYGYAENGNVEDALWAKDSKTVLSWRERFKICLGVASGMTYLHEKLCPRILHRDIKPANILLDKDLIPKVADFGLAKHFKEEMDVHVTQVISGTRGYFAPEYVLEGILTTKIDVFSFGILVLEIVSGRKNFDPSLPPEEISLKSWAQHLHKCGLTLKLLDRRLHGDHSEVEVIKVINIALMCVRTDPDLRPSMSEVETMLLEGEEKTFDRLWGTGSKGDDPSYRDQIYKTFKEGTGDSTFSTPRSGHGSQASRGVGSSTMLQLEQYPLLRGESIESDVETPGRMPSEDAREEYAREEYLRALRSMKRSLSERINRPPL